MKRLSDDEPPKPKGRWARLMHMVDGSKKIRYSSIREARRAVLHFFIYIIFLALASLVTQTTNNVPMYYLNDAIHRQIIGRRVPMEPGLISKYSEIDSLDRYWDFVLYTFLPLLDTGDFRSTHKESIWKFTNETNQFDGIYGDLYHRVIMHGIVLLGPPRFRQIMVEGGHCKEYAPFSKYMDTCYATYTWSNERRTDYRGTKWVSMWEDGAMPIIGEIEVYLGAGYITSLSYDNKLNFRLVEHLRDTKWIDRSTRISLIELSLFHVNTRLFESVKLKVERPATGGLVPSYSLRSMRQETIFTDSNWAIRIASCSYYLMVVLFTFREIRLIKKYGFCKYIGNVVNLADFTCYVCSYIMLLIHVIRSFYHNNIMDIVKTSDRYINLDWASALAVVYNNIAAITIFLAWIRILTFLVFNRTMVIFVNVVRESTSEMVGFLLMFFAMLMAYAECGRALFGDKDEQFYNLESSILTMMRWVVGDSMYDSFKMKELKAGIYYMSFVIIVYALLLFAFLVIINCTYDEIQSSMQTRASKLGLLIRLFFRSLYDLLYFIFCGKRKKRAKDDEDLKSELASDQRIDPQEAAERAAMRRQLLQNPVTLSQSEYLPRRMECAAKRVKALEEVTGPVLKRLINYYYSLRREQGLPRVNIDISDLRGGALSPTFF
ncbi:polycystin-2-like protein 2 isoform X1 [Drosophila montana]|uniref:polycystin-2-like protein 2 isoform X1 n=1 Tax=Drosophila montana TaxID=40370 RepID=UPI00313F1D31